MNKILYNIIDIFGFDTFQDFTTSMIHFKLLKITIPISISLGVLSTLLGFQTGTTIAFFIMVLFELISGLAASLHEKKKIKSRKFSRFGFKLLTWLVLIGVINTFKNQYTGGILGWFISTTSSTIIGYVMFEYLLSIIENLERITGQEIPLKKYLNTIFKKLIG